MQEYKIDIKDVKYKSNAWVKKLIKNYDHGPLSTLISDRLRFASTTGPYVDKPQGERAWDIITTLSNSSEECRSKIEPAVALILWKLKFNKLTFDSDLLEGVFNLITENNYRNCFKLVKGWLFSHKEKMISYSSDKSVYYDGMMALAKTQDLTDKAVENFWIEIWQSKDNYFWTPAYLGLRRMNPTFAAKEISTLIQRGKHADLLLCGMWVDERSRSLLEEAIIDELKKDNGIGGVIINTFINAMGTQTQSELLYALKERIAS